VLREKGIDHWWAGSDEEFVPASHKGQTLTKGFDTLDVWFDSGSSWSLIADAHLRPASEPLADVYLEGSDQHRGWFQSSILIRLAALEKDGHKPMAPYRNLITHGFTTDEKGNKMSKSLGNGISPMDVVNGKKVRRRLCHTSSNAHQGRDAFGSDTLRVWAAGTDYTRDASIGPSSISHAAELLRKLRSTLRFMLANTANATPLPLDRAELTLVSPGNTFRRSGTLDPDDTRLNDTSCTS
jgi:isoleucyl-tRNA synthetase